MGAIVEGTLEVDLTLGCVWLATGDGSRHPVVWPAGATSEEGPFAVVLPGGQRVFPGDRVSGGGGYVDAAAATAGLDPFPLECIQDGQAAVFNPDSELEVSAGAGDEAASTLVGRFSVPEPIGLELIAVSPNGRSVAVADLVTGTVHLYEQNQFLGPEDAIDGASGGGGFVHLWAQGTVYSYPGRLTDEPIVFRPETLREMEGIAPTLEALPAPDGERLWLVQDGSGLGPTLIELVSLVEGQLARLHRLEVPGSWQPMGATSAGLVLIANEGTPRTRLVALNGTTGSEATGEAISVGWSGAAIFEDGELRLLGPDLTGLLVVERPSPGSWVSVGGPLIPSSAPPIRTGGSIHLVGLAEGEGPDRVVELVVVRQDGSTRVIHQTGYGAVATLSRTEDWVAVIDQHEVTLVPATGDVVELGEIFPAEHWVLSGG